MSGRLRGTLRVFDRDAWDAAEAARRASSSTQIVAPLGRAGRDALHPRRPAGGQRRRGGRRRSGPRCSPRSARTRWPRPSRAWAARTSPGTSRRCPARWPGSGVRRPGGARVRPAPGHLRHRRGRARRRRAVHASRWPHARARRDRDLTVRTATRRASGRARARSSATYSSGAPAASAASDDQADRARRRQPALVPVEHVDPGQHVAVQRRHAQPDPVVEPGVGALPVSSAARSGGEMS